MKGFEDNSIDPIDNRSRNRLNFSESDKLVQGSVSCEAEPTVGSYQKSSSWSGIWTPGLSSIIGNFSSTCTSSGDNKSEANDCVSARKKKPVGTSGKTYYEGCRAAVRRMMMMNTGSIRSFLGFSRDTSTSKSDIWLLGVCYRVSEEGGVDGETSNPTQSEGFAAFVEDFSSRVLVTYRKGFSPIGDSKYSSDVNWGCMLRSSQMLVAQAFVVHKLGRSWRKSPDKPLDQSYIEILQLFGDSEESPCSIHNLLQAGKPYGLAPGSWVGPYAMCRTWESLVRNKREESNNEVASLMTAIFVVSGDEDGERGGAPVLCIEDISRHCSEFCGGQSDWGPILLMVPLVLGLEKVNPRYLPLLSATFTFPQSLGVMGGRPGASTYIVGVQDEKAFYLDPHEVQQAVDFKKDSIDIDTSSYHCNVVRHMPLDSIDSSLAIGFYCRDKSDFDDFCLRASELIDQSNGAPLFTIAQTRSSTNTANYNSAMGDTATENPDYDHVDEISKGEFDESGQEDDWQLL